MQARRLIFGTGLLEPTLSGRKTMTLRLYRPEAHLFRAGDTLVGEFKDGAELDLIVTRDTRVFLFSELTDQEARDDGFANAADAFVKMKTYYPNLKKTDTMAIIYYRLA